MINILIADDQDAVKIGLLNLIENTIGQTKVYIVSDSIELSSLLRCRSFDMMILEVGLIQKCYIEISREILEFQKNMQVFVFTRQESNRLFRIVQFLPNLAAYLTKKAELEQIIGALKAVLSNETYFNELYSVFLSGKLTVNEIENGIKGLKDILSDRELRVAQLTVKGMIIKEIAQMLGIAQGTVCTYKARIYKKLKVKNKYELTSLIRDSRFVNSIN